MFLRDMREITRASSGVRTLTFPNTTENAKASAFYAIASLKSVIMNDQLEQFGEEPAQDEFRD